MLRRNCIFEEIDAAGEEMRRHRCLVCRRETRSRYPADHVHVMCLGTPEQYAAWRAAAVQRFLDELFALAEGRPSWVLGLRSWDEGLRPKTQDLRSYDEMEALYGLCQTCPDWQVTLCRRLKCPGRPQKYLRLLADPMQRCGKW
jgi:hypothetical protein